MDQALLDNKIGADKIVSSSDKSTAIILARREESKKQTSALHAKRKAEYEAETKGRENSRKKDLSKRYAADHYLLRTQYMTANAALASAAVAKKQAEQFGAFLAFYAHKNNMSMPKPFTAMPPLKNFLPLEIDSALLSQKKEDISPRSVDQEFDTINSTSSESGSGRTFVM